MDTILAILAAGIDPTTALPGEGWTALGVIATAILGFLGVRFVVMEKEIRRLRDYSWLKNEQAEQRMKYLEERADATEEYIDKLQLAYFLIGGRELPDRVHVPKPDLVSATISPNASKEEIEEQIEKVISAPGGPETEPLDHT